MKKICISIIEDEQLIAELLVRHFENDSEIEVLATHKNGNSFVKYLQEEKPIPNIILLDLKMEGMDGMDVINHLKAEKSKIKIIVLSSYYKSNLVGYMLKTGVNAFLPKSTSSKDLRNIIINVYDNDFFFKSEQIDALKQQINNKLPKPKLNNTDDLTAREIDVLNLICQQLTTHEIADKLFISKRTVEGHRTNLLLKADVKNTAGLIIWAIKNEVIDVSQVLLGF